MIDIIQNETRDNTNNFNSEEGDNCKLMDSTQFVLIGTLHSRIQE